MQTNIGNQNVNSYPKKSTSLIDLWFWQLSEPCGSRRTRHATQQHEFFAAAAWHVPSASHFALVLQQNTKRPPVWSGPSQPVASAEPCIQ